MQAIVHAVETLMLALATRFERIGEAGADLASFAASLVGQNLSIGALLVMIVAVVGVSVVSHVLTRRLVGDHLPMAAFWPFISALVLGLAAARLLSGEAGLLRSALKTWAVLTPLALVMRPIVDRLVLSNADTPLSRRLAAFSAGMSFAVIWGLVGVGALTTLRQWQAGFGLRDLIGTVFLSLPVWSILLWNYNRHAGILVTALAGPQPNSYARRRLARMWPTTASVFLVAALLLLQLSITISGPLPPVAFLITLILVLLAPHIDARLAAWAAKGLAQARLPVALVAMRRTVRPAFLTFCIAVVTAVWASPVAVATGFRISGIAGPAVEVAGVVLIAAFLWNLLGVATDRVLAEDAAIQGGDHSEAETSPKSRLSTLLPLVTASFKVVLLALAGLTALLAMGVNVWPLVTGLSVFGLAIGFGSQTLVKDIVSGLFFLIDDAFRLGEYIEISGAKGSVEKISVRSLSVRHPRGSLATIPYGQIGKVQNFSRDWVIEKMAFRVAFDTDVEKVRKLFKQIGQDLMADPEIAAELIEPFKSQGIRAVEDGTLVIGGKFKAIAGRQFAARKAILAAVQKAFRENDIKVVPKPIAPAP